MIAFGFSLLQVLGKGQEGRLGVADAEEARSSASARDRQQPRAPKELEASPATRDASESQMRRSAEAPRAARRVRASRGARRMEECEAREEVKGEGGS